MTTIANNPSNPNFESQPSIEIKMKSNLIHLSKTPVKLQLSKEPIKGKNDLNKKCIISKMPERVPITLREFQYGCSKRPKLSTVKRPQSQKSENAQRRSNLSSAKLQQNEKIPIKIVKEKIEFDQVQKEVLELSRNKGRKKTSESKSPANNIENSNIMHEQLVPNPEKEQHIDHFAQTSIQFKVRHSPKDKNGVQGQQQLNLKEILKLKADSFSPSKTMFNRYNYENYENYDYRNPFRHTKYESLQDRNPASKYNFPKNHKYLPNQGSTKNLEIVFCQTKHKEFVEATNKQFENEIKKRSMSQNSLISEQRKSCQAMKSLQGQLKQLDKRHSKDFFSTCSQVEKWNYSQYNSKTLLSSQSKVPNSVSDRKSARVFPGSNILKSCLSNSLADFKKLERLTQLQEEQRKNTSHRQTKTIQATKGVNMKTVSVNLLQQKYTFLKKLKAKEKSAIYSCLFDQENGERTGRISIHDYLKFNRIFINRDAPFEEVSDFVKRILTSDGSVSDRIERFGCNRTVEAVQELLFEIYNKKNSDSVEAELLNQVTDNQQFCWGLVSLIINS